MTLDDMIQRTLLDMSKDELLQIVQEQDAARTIVVVEKAKKAVAKISKTNAVNNAIKDMEKMSLEEIARLLNTLQV